MSSAVRYNFVEGNSIPTTIANFPSNNDGDDRKEIIIRRVITPGDIGTSINEIGYQGSGTTNPGAIAAIIPSGQTVLALDWCLERPADAAVNGMTLYTKIDGKRPDMANPDFVTIDVGVATDNTIRVVDTVPNGLSPVVANDVLLLRVILGNRVNSSDVLNFR